MPRVRVDEDSVDPIVFGSNVRELRHVRGWSIDVLAKRAGVAPHTVLRIENGYPSTQSRRTRIAYALDTVLERLGTTGPPGRNDVAVHGAEDDHWISLLDWRPAIPEDNAELIQSPDERARLGRLTFVTQFVKVLRCRLPKGKLIAGMLELHGDLPPSCYLGGEIFAFALLGDSVLNINGEKFPLKEGTATTFDCTKPFYFSPETSIAAGGDHTLVLYVRLEETEPIDSRRPKRGRAVEGQFEVWADPEGKVPNQMGSVKRSRAKKPSEPSTGRKTN